MQDKKSYIETTSTYNNRYASHGQNLTYTQDR